METTYDRPAMIEQCVTASRRPLPLIAECMEYECTDGKWRGVYNMHGGHKRTGASRLAGYCRMDQNGIRHGKTFQSIGELTQDMQRVQEHNEDEFRADLNEMSDERLAECHKFWTEGSR